MSDTRKISERFLDAKLVNIPGCPDFVLRETDSINYGWIISLETSLVWAKRSRLAGRVNELLNDLSELERKYL